MSATVTTTEHELRPEVAETIQKLQEQKAHKQEAQHTAERNRMLAKIFGVLAVFVLIFIVVIVMNYASQDFSPSKFENLFASVSFVPPVTLIGATASGSMSSATSTEIASGQVSGQVSAGGSSAGSGEQFAAGVTGILGKLGHIVSSSFIDYNEDAAYNITKALGMEKDNYVDYGNYMMTEFGPRA